MGELSTEEWKNQKKVQRAIFTAKQNLPYEVKLRRQARRAWEFWTEMESQDKNCHVSVGGIHLEQRPHRFDKLRERNPKEWEFWMYRCCTDPNTDEKYGWGRVLDYIGVEWEDIPAVQMSLEDFL